MDIPVEGAMAHAATGGRQSGADEPAVVFIHGAGMDRSVWQLQTRNVAFMGRRAYAVDLPGHGRSQGPALTSIEAMADWLAAFMDAAGLDCATLVGHSMGALVALECASRYPDRTSGLCLMGVAETMPVHPDLLAAAKGNEPLAAELIVYWGLGAKAQTGGHPHPGLWVPGASHRLLADARPDVLFTDLTACNAYREALAAARRVRCKTCFVLGDGDQMTPPGKAETLIAAIDGASRVMIENCGHMMMTERPHQVHGALRGFV